MPAWVIEQLEIWKALIAVTEAQIGQVEAKLLAATAVAGLFVGEGELSHELIARELIDPHRFKNARQVGNFFGLCPSESSSGESRRLGAITKHGSPRLRRLLIQLAWRVVIFQPEYRGMKRWQSVLGLGVPKTGGAARKKAIVALARQLVRPPAGLSSPLRLLSRGSLAHRHGARPGRGTGPADATAAGQRRGGPRLKEKATNANTHAPLPTNELTK